MKVKIFSALIAILASSAVHAENFDKTLIESKLSESLTIKISLIDQQQVSKNLIDMFETAGFAKLATQQIVSVPESEMNRTESEE